MVTALLIGAGIFCAGVLLSAIVFYLFIRLMERV